MASGNDRSSPRLQMQRRIGVWSAISIMVGTVIGSSIFISPTAVLLNSGSVALSLLMWFIPVLPTLLIILCYMELASIVPKAGAEYVYFRHTFGDLAGFLYAWTYCTVMLPAFHAILSLTATNYIMYYFIEDCSYRKDGSSVISILLLVSITALNCTSVKYITRVQGFLTSLKVVALIVIICTGIAHLCQGKTGYLTLGFEGSDWSPSAMATSVQVGIFSYFGWQGMFSVMEELKNPKRTVPISVAATMLIVTALYIMTNAAYFTALSPSEMVASPAVAMTFASKSLGYFAIVIPLCVALNVIGTLNASMMFGSRVFFAAGRDGLLPQIFAAIHIDHCMPIPALLILCLASAVYIVTGNSITLIEYQGICLTLTFVLIAVTVLYLKWRQPTVKRPVCMPVWVPLVALVISVSLFALGVVQKPQRSLEVLFIICCGLPAYLTGWILRKYASKYISWYDSVAVAIQKALRVAHTEGDIDASY